MRVFVRLVISALQKFLLEMSHLQKQLLEVWYFYEWNVYNIFHFLAPYYLSPEIWRNKPYDDKSDVWSLGVVLYEITTLNRPFDAPSMQGLQRAVQAGRYTPIPSSFSQDLSKVYFPMFLHPFFFTKFS
jgi:hypothetical protein